MVDKEKEMESIVFCPSCGEQIYVVMASYPEVASELMGMFDGLMEIEKTVHFYGENKCKCGKVIHTTLHVTVAA